MMKITSPMERLVNRKPDGTELLENDYWGEIRKNHGYELMLFERREFLQTLYDKLPDKTKILFNKRVTTVKETYDAVEVSLADGTAEKGDILIRCDGIHSIVRQAMWDNMDKLSPGILNVKERKAMMTSWTCLLGMGPGEPSLRNELSCVHNDGYSFLIGTRPNRIFFFVFFRVKKPYSQYTHPRWSDADAEKAALSVTSHPLSETLVFGDLWRRKYRGQIVDIEEGILSHSFFGRTVLVGDATHKVTPNIALGGNSGMESIALLVNLLRPVVTTYVTVNSHGLH
ncbi:hypothetical protein F5884DRAFT_150673 [Xylogone sp. PMI_703]|nr:hypothetical protein F5884DRAFT_150673 [Xylogone sp. PMI_703]